MSNLGIVSALLLTSMSNLAFASSASSADLADSNFEVVAKAPRDLNDPRGENITAIFVGWQEASGRCPSGVADQVSPWATSLDPVDGLIVVRAMFSCVDQRDLPCEPSVPTNPRPPDIEPPYPTPPFPPGVEPSYPTVPTPHC